MYVCVSDCGMRAYMVYAYGLPMVGKALQYVNVCAYVYEQ